MQTSLRARLIRPAFFAFAFAFALACDAQQSTSPRVRGASAADLSLSNARHAHVSKPTIVLVHGAWADATGWQEVTLQLQQQGYKVAAVQNTLASLAADVATTKRLIDGQTGAVVVVGHSYGGAVMSAAVAGNPNVSALVYIAAFAPAPKEPVGAFFAQYPSPLGAALVPDVAGFVFIDPAKYHDVFAADLPRRLTQAMAAAQKPIFGHAFEESNDAAAWQQLRGRVWYMVTQQDNAVNPALQRFYAGRMGASTIEIRSSHLPFISHPREVVKLIVDAAESP